MSDPTLQLEQLRRISIALALRVLRDLGELAPMATVLKSTGDVVAIGGDSNNGELPHPHRIERLRFQLRRDALREGYEATAIIYDALVADASPDAVDALDAIAIELDHAGGLSLLSHVPYHYEDHLPITGDISTQPGGDYIFRRTAES